MAAGLAGAATATLFVTVFADRLGRRRTLLALAAATAAGGIAMAAVATPAGLAVAAFLGMLNGMGRDRGAALVLEQAALPSVVGDDRRTAAFARYNVLQDVGHAVGSLLAGLPVLIDVPAEGAVRAAGFGVYSVLILATVPLYLAASPRIEAGARGRLSVSPASRRILWTIGPLFALDSLGGGFLTTALLSYFFHERFGVGQPALGGLFFAARILNALSHLAAAWLARRIGLVNTMVFTHLPSSLLLLTVAWAPSFAVAAVLFLLREGLVEMDVPTRQSYVLAVVRPEERTVASGLTHLVRMAGWAVAPAFAGWLMQGLSLLAPLVVGAALKVAYDVILYVSFRDLRPPEERA